MAKNNKIHLSFEQPLQELYDKLDKLKVMQDDGKLDLSEEIKMMEKRIENQRREIFSALNPSQIVQVARFIARPTALDYINYMFTDFVELHGDRNFSDDPAMVCGIARLDGRSVIVIGHQKGHSTKE